MLRVGATFAAVCSLLVASGDGLVAARWSFDEHVGVAFMRGGRACLAIGDRFLAPATRAQLVITSDRQQMVDASIGVADPLCADGVETLAPVVGYRLLVDGADGTRLLAPSIAVIHPAGALRRRGNTVRGDIDGDGREEAFRSCTSTEGVHLTVWSGAPLAGTRRWHAYVPLGYDVTPTCAPGDMVPD